MPQSTTLASKRQLSLAVFLVIVVLWSLVHWLHRDIVIFHDSWLHNFPKIFSIGRNGSCGHFGQWLMWPDSGAPAIIYALSTSLTQPVRLILLKAFACLEPEPSSAMAFYKLHIYVMYLVLAAGMYVLGRIIFRHWLTPSYLAAATLFAGMCLDAAHSDQIAVIAFWVPWLVAAWTLADRHAGTSKGALFLNLAALFFCVALLDQYPHFVALTGGIGLVLYAALRFDGVKLLASRWKLLWPTALLLMLAIAQLLIVQLRISDYVPSLRIAITVDPSQFGETGFVQPSAVFGMFFPLTFTAAFEAIGSGFGPFGSRGFIYQLDILICYFGTLPLLLIVCWLAGGGQREQKIGWLAFTLAILLVSLQQSRLYLLLFHLPFFNVFRSYFLYIIYVVIGVLVMSAYGLDSLLTATSEERTARLRAALRTGAIAFLTAAVLLVLVTIIGRGLGAGAFAYLKPMAGDIVLVGAALLLIWWGARRATFGAREGLVFLAVLIGTQALYAAGIYGILGITDRAAFARYEMSDALSTPISAAELTRPDQIKRVPCPTFGSCYLALHDAASLRRDLEGTFLRHRLNPVFQDALAPEVKQALTGITHPIFWFSDAFQPAKSIETLNGAFDAHRKDISEHLAKQTYLLGYQAATGNDPTPLDATLSDLHRGPDTLSFSYRSNKAAVVNMGVTYDHHWIATVNGTAAPILSGNFNNISLFVPKGEGTISLRFRDYPSRFFFWSRWLMVALASASAIFLCLTLRRWDSVV